MNENMIPKKLNQEQKNQGYIMNIENCTYKKIQNLRKFYVFSISKLQLEKWLL